MRAAPSTRAGLRLDPAEITATVSTLRRRIEERFPRSNLSRTGEELLRLAEKAEQRTAWIRRPLIALRLGIAGLALVGGGMLASGVRAVAAEVVGLDLSELLQGLEAALSITVLLGAALLFLSTLERRVKRIRAMRALHELRILAHLVDMLQLTKDPIDPRGPRRDTPSSPRREMEPWELARYLDYASEILALTSKIGALYISDFDDPVVLADVDGLQRLLDGLVQKIWHKVTILDRIIASLRSPLASPVSHTG